MNTLYSLENPITRRLTQRHGPLDFAALGWLALVAAVLWAVPPADRCESLKITLPVGGVLYAVLRTALDSGHITGWRRGRSLEEMLLALTPWQIVDGIAGFSLWRTLQAGSLGAGLATVVGVGLRDSSLIWPVFLGLPLLLSLVFALSYLASGGWPALCVLLGFPCLCLAFQSDFWPLWVSLFLLGLGALARCWAAQSLAPQPKLTRPVVRRPGGVAQLWSQNPIVVRELRREARAAGAGRCRLWLHRHGSFLLMMTLLSANLLLRGQMDAARLQWNACLLAGSLIILQTLRAALTTSSAVVAERQAKTLESLALSGLSPTDFLQGWAQLGWRPRMGENLLGALAALGLTMLGLALIPPNPPECSLYTTPPFATMEQALVVLGPLLAVLAPLTVAGAHLGLLASALSSTPGQACQNCLGFLVLAGLGCLWWCSAVGSLWPLCLVVFLAAPALAALAKNRLSEGAR